MTAVPTRSTSTPTWRSRSPDRGPRGGAGRRSWIRPGTGLFHLDFEVDDIEAEQRRVLALGATLRRDCAGPDGYGFRVYADPVGHPFCLCRNTGVIWTDQGPVWPARDQ